MEKIETEGTDKRFIQANKEALWATALALCYFAWWYLSAYIPGEVPVEEYTYIFGFPTWFFLSCMVGFVLFSILAALMVATVFKDISLADSDKGAGKP